MPAAFVEPLLEWYQRHRAEHPWRQQSDPYRLWLAEVMLQQTQVATVIPYYRRIVAAYPTVQALAQAPLDDLLKHWEGLGYYRRAQHLHRAAARIVADYDGRLPRDVKALQALPGIGPYTAAAIASIAYGQAEPLLDGNVIRLFARLLDLPDDIRRSATRAKLWKVAADWVPAQRAGDYNQALMELGQRVCKPRNPRCAACPLRGYCRAYAAGTVAQRPVRAARAALPHVDVAAGIIRDAQQRILLAQRPLEGMLGGLWEFPGGKRERGESLTQCLQRELREELAIEVAIESPFTRVKHSFTHFKITLHAYNCRYVGALAPYNEPQALGAQRWLWAQEGELQRYSFGKADRLVIAKLRGDSA